LKLLCKELKNTLDYDIFKYKTIIIMDNASIHKAKITVKAMKELGLKIFTIPAYSPELNLIEH
jgi:transposase